MSTETISFSDRLLQEIRHAANHHGDNMFLSILLKDMPDDTYQKISQLEDLKKKISAALLHHIGEKSDEELQLFLINSRKAGRKIPEEIFQGIVKIAADGFEIPVSELMTITHRNRSRKYAISVAVEFMLFNLKASVDEIARHFKMKTPACQNYKYYLRRLDKNSEIDKPILSRADKVKEILKQTFTE